MCVPGEQRVCQLGLGFKTSVLALDREILQGGWGLSWVVERVGNINRTPPRLGTGDFTQPAPGSSELT